MKTQLQDDYETAAEGGCRFCQILQWLVMGPGAGPMWAAVALALTAALLAFCAQA